MHVKSVKKNFAPRKLSWHLGAGVYIFENEKCNFQMANIFICFITLYPKIHLISSIQRKTPYKKQLQGKMYDLQEGEKLIF